MKVTQQIDALRALAVICLTGGTRALAMLISAAVGPSAWAYRLVPCCGLRAQH
jgi:hypothetical protein